MRELKLPSNNLNRNNYIENLPVNNYGYVVPWAVKVNEYDDVFINKKFIYSQQPGGTVKLKIKRTNQGIIIFLDNNYKFDDIGELDSIQNYEPVIGFDENENETLENQLEKAIEDEDYELANKIKIKMKQQIDEIKRMQQLANIKLNENVNPQERFDAVKKALDGKKYQIKMEKDGIYIKLTGREEEGEANSVEWAKVLSFSKTQTPAQEQAKVAEFNQAPQKQISI